MKLIYNKLNGKIIGQISNDDDVNFIFRKRGQEFLESLDGMIVDEKLDNIKHYYIKDSGVLKHSDEEILEVDMYGDVLSEEERLNILLTPTREEIQKAENTIEMLSMLQEVGLL